MRNSAKAGLALVPALMLASLVTSGAPASAETRLMADRLGTTMLNPQPLPPRWRYDRWRWRLLNPQPLPPNPCRSCPGFRLKNLNPRIYVR